LLPLKSRLFGAGFFRPITNGSQRSQVGQGTRCIRQLDQWWAMHRLAAPDAVLNDIEAALSLLAQQPGIGTSYEC
jgi:hypothetical protein